MSMPKPMTVKDLMEALQRFPQDARVVVEDAEYEGGGGGGYEPVSGLREARIAGPKRHKSPCGLYMDGDDPAVVIMNEYTTEHAAASAEFDAWLQRKNAERAEKRKAT